MQHNFVELSAGSSTAPPTRGQDVGIIREMDELMISLCPSTSTSSVGFFKRLAGIIASTWTTCVGSVSGILMAVVNRFVKVSTSIVTDPDGAEDSFYVSFSVQFPNNFTVRNILSAKHRLDGKMHRLWGPGGQERTVAVGYKWKTVSKKFPGAAYSFSILTLTPKSEEEADAIISRYNKLADETGGGCVPILQVEGGKRLDHHFSVTQDGASQICCDLEFHCVTSPSQSHLLSFSSTGQLIPHSELREVVTYPHPHEARMRPF
mmetsp:Transcript_19617/g.30737  ORF Transcript_19617/g.30737 Transcript_19617/m.30737 type:complete len:263 (+) Transcript_19617:2-790(+)